MTNEQKYKTADERIKAFDYFCKGQGDRCNHCEIAKKRLSISRRSECVVYWLALEAEEEKLEPCPFCGGECLTSNAVGGMWRVYCEKDMTCLYSSGTFATEAEAIAAHNRVARAVRAAKEDAK